MDDFYEFVSLPRHFFTILALFINKQYFMLCILREKGKFLLQLILNLNTSTPKTLRNILLYVSLLQSIITTIKRKTNFLLAHEENCVRGKIAARISPCKRRG